MGGPQKIRSTLGRLFIEMRCGLLSANEAGKREERHGEKAKNIIHGEEHNFV